MRFAIHLLLLSPTISFAQTAEIIEQVERKLAKQRTAKWVLEQEAPDGGFYLAPQDPKSDAAPKPMLRATNGAVRALKYLGFPLLNMEREKHAAFVLKCYDPKTGAFAEPGGKPDVAITSIGVMAAMELGVPKEKFAKAMDYLRENAKTFEEVRIAAAAVEAWGVKECPFKLDTWQTTARQFAKGVKLETGEKAQDYARDVGSLVAFQLRLGNQLNEFERTVGDDALGSSQREDGGWGKKGEKASDIETTYRVMRALMLLKGRPKEMKKLRAFIESHRNEDHGYATKPSDKSSMSGAYYCVIVTKWLDEMEAKK
jgi:prenyltransferase beta subunit